MWVWGALVVVWPLTSALLPTTRVLIGRCTVCVALVKETPRVNQKGICTL
jgi:hypothetical protein